MMWQRRLFSSGFRGAEMEPLEDKERNGCLLTSRNVENSIYVCTLIQASWCRTVCVTNDEMRCETIWETNDEMRLSFGLVHANVTEDLNIRCISTVCSAHPHRWSKEVVWQIHFGSDIVTESDHRWQVLGVQIPPGNYETKLPVENSHINNTEKGMSTELASEDHANCIFNMEQIVHSEFVSPGWMIGSVYFTKKSCKIWERLSDSVNGPLSFLCTYLY